jgi:hypothetical protein
MRRKKKGIIKKVYWGANETSDPPLLQRAGEWTRLTIRTCPTSAKANGLELAKRARWFGLLASGRLDDRSRFVSVPF